MLPPPVVTYESVIELFQSAQTFANSQGYVLMEFTAAQKFIKDKQLPAGCTSVEALIDELKKGNYIYEFKCNDTVMDRELTLINALKMTFPDSTNLLCLWHINKNIIKNFEFDMKWQHFIYTYTNKLHIIKYLEETWISLKEKFIKAWTNKFLHLGTTITSCIEDAHTIIKTYLCTSAGDLCDVCIKLSLAVNNQKQELDTKISSEKFHFPTFVQNNSFYANIKVKISNFALKKVDEQYQRIKCATAQDLLPLCTGSFLSTMGLPCLTLDDFHEHWWIQDCSSIPSIETNIQELQPLLQTLQEKYEEWPEHQQSAAQEKLNNLINTLLTVLQNPQIVRTRGKPASASNHQKNDSTRRDPSGFELVEHKIK
ncbi:6757_t:CDS:2 [Cetraspora pellucida]|uniref:6757_t:CDS:1 n=1 Tax=Cetraspora pellucida TaxID=1433469 RepID=A0A9N9CF77_9GLOM|nr:6757_t:CDS:2 [Cetraspora pellucida]